MGGGEFQTFDERWSWAYEPRGMKQTDTSLSEDTHKISYVLGTYKAVTTQVYGARPTCNLRQVEGSGMQLAVAH